MPAHIDLSPVLVRAIHSLQQQCGQEAAYRLAGSGSLWMIPGLIYRDDEYQGSGWSGDLFDVDAMSAPFDRKEINQQLVEAMTGDPGTSGDLVTGTMQIDQLACMERAFRARHSSRKPRMMLHAAARTRGHGSPRGTFAATVLGHISDLISKNKAAG